MDWEAVSQGGPPGRHQRLGATLKYLASVLPVCLSAAQHRFMTTSTADATAHAFVGYRSSPADCCVCCTGPAHSVSSQPMDTAAGGDAFE